MKGIVFNLLEDVVTAHHDADTWDALLDKAGLSGAYTSLGSYPDKEIERLVLATAEMLQISLDEVLCWFGQQAIPLLTQRYPVFFANHQSTRSFLLTLNNIIHPEVKKMYKGAEVPTFDFNDNDEHLLVMGYYSARQLCPLAEGLTRGAAAYFKENIQFSHTACMREGDLKCVFHVSFNP
ncbi:MAG TPA: heme NO-binding domain-containing protein [Agitococcus sp.]|nr:heme NO-binding domain-containing protein [Agitococcus sp.]